MDSATLKLKRMQLKYFDFFDREIYPVEVPTVRE